MLAINIQIHDIGARLNVTVLVQLDGVPHQLEVLSLDDVQHQLSSQ